MSAQARIAPTSSGQRSRERSTHARRSFTPWARARAAGFRGRARGRLLRRRRSRCRRHLVSAEARRNLVGNLQRCLLGHVHPPVEAVRIEADGIDQALTPERDVPDHRQRAGQHHQVRRGRGGCHLHGLRRGTVDVGSLQERSARRRLERSQDRVRTPVWAEFTTHDGGPLLTGLRAGGGPPVLLLHGGPGLGFGYLRDLADELAEENDVAWYQQRGLEPSAVEGPYSVALDVADARRAVDPLGSIGDGRWPEFDEEIFRRTPETVRERAREIDEVSMAGEASEELA